MIKIFRAATAGQSRIISYFRPHLRQFSNSPASLLAAAAANRAATEAQPESRVANRNCRNSETRLAAAVMCCVVILQQSLAAALSFSLFGFQFARAPATLFRLRRCSFSFCLLPTVLGCLASLLPPMMLLLVRRCCSARLLSQQQMARHSDAATSNTLAVHHFPCNARPFSLSLGARPAVVHIYRGHVFHQSSFTPHPSYVRYPQTLFPSAARVVLPIPIRLRLSSVISFYRLSAYPFHS